FINLDDEISYKYYDSSGKYIFSDTLKNASSINFSNTYFTLNNLDEIYGIYCDNSLKMMFLPSNSSSFIESEILSYDYTKFEISFPFLNIINDNIHIFYYVYSIDSINTCALFHHVKHNNIWTENKIDFIEHIVLDNYNIVWNQDIPIIFYFNLVNGFEELFFSKFNTNTLSWSNPIQITNSKRNKVYLNIIKDSMNFYHITFCEEINNGYAVKYLNGYLNDDMFKIDTFNYINSPSLCMYPSLLKKNSELFITWIEFGRLYTNKSIDLGKTWSKHNIEMLDDKEAFIRSKFFSNYDKDKQFNVNSVFTTIDDIGLLGF
ncbi:MAG: hypothetical protein ACRDD7_09625, partial [Peptostreptococcaceae bacterium]